MSLLREDSINYPNESYLRGALWLGRNLTMLSEDLSDEIETFRSKFLSELATISQDMDLRRCNHRLSLLGSSGVNQIHSLVFKNRGKFRDILKV